jgi:hypothetical protein
MARKIGQPRFGSIRKKMHKGQELVTCPVCGMKAWPEQVKRKACCAEANKTHKSSVLPNPGGKPLDPDARISKNDVFAKGKVLSGGGYGLGKSRKH